MFVCEVKKASKEIKILSVRTT